MQFDVYFNIILFNSFFSFLIYYVFFFCFLYQQNKYTFKGSLHGYPTPPPPPPNDSAKTRLCVTYSRCSTIEVAKSKIIQPFIAFVEVTICKNVKIQMGR